MGSSKNILIVGAGWLGAPMAKVFAEQGHQVWATRTSAEGVATLTAQGIQGLEFALSAEPVSKQAVQAQKGELLTATGLAHFDIIIGAFPPKLRHAVTDVAMRGYANRWQHLGSLAKALDVKQILMISTSGVYPDMPKLMHEDDASFIQASQSDAFSDKSKAMLAAEQAVIDSQVPYCILRCAGLIGPNRHPKRFVQHLKTVSSLAKANMVHQADVIGICQYMIEQSISNQVLNVSIPSDLTKAQFYQAALGSEPLTDFVTLNQTPNKEVSPSKLIGLGYRFIYPDLYSAIDAC